MKTTNLHKHPLYQRWANIKDRCYNPNCKDYPRYGARGIYVCDEWFDNVAAFIVWAIDNGFHRDLQIDRIDNNGPYSPANCRFVNAKTNSTNRKSTVWIEEDGLMYSLTDFCLKHKVKRVLAYSRIARGYSPKDAVLLPKRKNQYA